MRRGDEETGSFEWKEVSHFQTTGKAQGYRVGFAVRYHGETEPDSDWDVLADDPYGIGNDGLCDLLRRWQKLALGGPGE